MAQERLELLAGAAAIALVLSVSRWERVVARCDRVFTAEAAVSALGGEFSSALPSQHVPRGVLCFSLGSVQA